MNNEEEAVYSAAEQSQEQEEEKTEIISHLILIPEWDASCAKWFQPSFKWAYYHMVAHMPIVRV